MKVALQVRMEQELHDALKKKAGESGFSVSGLVRHALLRFVVQDEVKSKTDAARGDVVAVDKEIGLMPWEQ